MTCELGSNALNWYGVDCVFSCGVDGPDVEVDGVPARVTCGDADGWSDVEVVRSKDGRGGASASCWWAPSKACGGSDRRLLSSPLGVVALESV